MNIHIIENEKFTPLFLEMVNDYFPFGSNFVYVYGNKKNYTSKSFDFVKFIDLFKDIDLNLIENNQDKMFVHGFYNGNILRFLYLNKHRIDFCKVVFISWGADIYNSKYRLMKPISGLKDIYGRLKIRLYERIKKVLMKKVRLYMTFACDDINIINGSYGANGIQFDCLYPSTVNLEDLNRIKKTKNDSINGRNRSIAILLGNSATETNQHIQMLNILDKYKNENISIICPLSYGDKEYAIKIKDYGERLFGYKFVPLMEYMSPVKYANILGKVDIAVFNHNRQQATGNIEILAYLGKKIFIRSDISSWNHYVVRDKCAFFDTKKIEGMSFEEFIDNPSEAIATNEKYFLQIWDINHVVSLWKKVMNYEV